MATTARPALPVFVVAPTGLRDRGGIGRLLTAIERAWHASGSAPPHRVVDSYGPRVLALSPIYFARALLQIVWYARRGRIRLLHVHMANGGSVVRKGIIVHLGAQLRLPVILHLHANDLDEF